jgi:hypothetical protein
MNINQSSEYTLHVKHLLAGAKTLDQSSPKLAGFLRKEGLLTAEKNCVRV